MGTKSAARAWNKAGEGGARHFRAPMIAAATFLSRCIGVERKNRS
jgi:hypothetical protein